MNKLVLGAGVLVLGLGAYLYISEQNTTPKTNISTNPIVTTTPVSSTNTTQGQNNTTNNQPVGNTAFNQNTINQNAQIINSASSGGFTPNSNAQLWFNFLKYNLYPSDYNQVVNLNNALKYDNTPSIVNMIHGLELEMSMAQSFIQSYSHISNINQETTWLTSVQSTFKNYNP